MKAWYKSIKLNANDLNIIPHYHIEKHNIFGNSLLSALKLFIYLYFQTCLTELITDV